jgi:hypothetical protein
MRAQTAQTTYATLHNSTVFFHWQSFPLLRVVQVDTESHFERSLSEAQRGQGRY